MKVHLYRLDNHAVTTLNTCFEVIVFQSDALSVTFAVSASEKLVLVLVGLVNSYSKKSVLAHVAVIDTIRTIITGTVFGVKNQINNPKDPAF